MKKLLLGLLSITLLAGCTAPRESNGEHSTDYKVDYLWVSQQTHKQDPRKYVVKACRNIEEPDVDGITDLDVEYDFTWEDKGDTVDVVAKCHLEGYIHQGAFYHKRYEGKKMTFEYTLNK